MAKHLWIGVALVVLALALGGVLWLRQGPVVPFTAAPPAQSADPVKDAVMDRVRQEQAAALAEDAARLPAEPQTEDLK